MASETYAPSPTNCVLGKGKIYFDRFSTAGVKQGFFELGNAKDLRASLNSTRAELNNYLTGEGGVYAEAEVTKVVTVSALVYEFNRKNIALLAAGNETTFTQTTQTVTGESLNTACALGAVYQTAFRSITPSAVKQGTVTLVSGTDWESRDTTSGLIKILSGGAATEGSAVTIDYTAAAITAANGKIVDLYAASTIEGQLLYVSDNSFGAQGELKYWRCSLQPGDWEGLIGDDFASSTLSFKVINDEVGTYGGSTDSPYGRWYRR
jgi:hypothetical protein